jgi:hypothetical protein
MYKKWPQHIPNCHKNSKWPQSFEMVIKIQHFPFKGLSKCKETGTDVIILKIFWLKKIAKKLAFFDSKQS